MVGDLTLPAQWSEATLGAAAPVAAGGTLLGMRICSFARSAILSAPIGCLTLGLFGLVIDVALIYICGHFVEGFAVSGLLYAILTAVLINAVCAIVGSR